jgi:hypothetical protein
MTVTAAVQEDHLRFQYGIRLLLSGIAVLALFAGLATWVIGIDEGTDARGVHPVPDVFVPFFQSEELLCLFCGRLPIFLVMIGWMCAVLCQEKRRPVCLLLFLGFYFFSLVEMTLPDTYYPMRQHGLLRFGIDNPTALRPRLAVPGRKV